MAKSKYNVVMHNASGIVGDLLEFRQRFGKTVFAKRRTVTVKQNAAQLATQEKFRDAVSYASSVFNDPSQKALYETEATPGVTVFNLAFRDYFKAPKIRKIQTENYTGNPGGLITINAVDDFLVKSVDVIITAADGSILEQGSAVQSTKREEWIYTVTVANPSLPGSKIRVSAKDLPGNTTIEEKTLI